MKKMKGLIALFLLNVLSLPYLLMALDDGTYIENLDVQDSSYMEQDLLADAESASSSNNTVIIIVVAVIVVAVVAFLILRKKKKQ